MATAKTHSIDQSLPQKLLFNTKKKNLFKIRFLLPLAIYSIKNKGA